MTRDEATGIWMASFNAWCEHPLPANERVAREAAATVIQQAFAERDGAWIDGIAWHKPAHRAVMASVKLGGWMSAALDDPAVCDAMKADIREWFSAGEPMETLGQALAAKGDSRG